VAVAMGSGHLAGVNGGCESSFAAARRPTRRVWRRERHVVVFPYHLHSFVNSGSGPLRQLDIHLSPNFGTNRLEGRGHDGEGV
jgi:hypothetical protein